MLEWNVYVTYFNDRKIKPYNVFDHYGFTEDLKKIARKYSNDKAEFADQVRSSVMYYFWSKSEWEIVLSELIPSCQSSCKRKIDVHDQIVMNWEHFINYLWEHKAELKLFKKYY